MKLRVFCNGPEPNWMQWIWVVAVGKSTQQFQLPIIHFRRSAIGHQDDHVGAKRNRGNQSIFMGGPSKAASPAMKFATSALFC